MKTYVVYFEFFGRKMRTKVKAYDRDDAIRQIKDRVIIHRVDEPDSEILDLLNRIFDGTIK